MRTCQKLRFLMLRFILRDESSRKDRDIGDGRSFLFFDDQENRFYSIETCIFGNPKIFFSFRK